MTLARLCWALGFQGWGGVPWGDKTNENPGVDSGRAAGFRPFVIRATQFFTEYFGFYLPKVMGGCPNA
jgi:hypothetical protein